jgi:predicted nucleic acid-binding protein
MRKKRVFVDSSVIIAAMFSPTGGSSLILADQRGLFAFETNEYAITEMKEAFLKKFKDESLEGKMFTLIGLSNIRILANPNPGMVSRINKYVPDNDATILASAMIHSDYLLTLDNGFFKDLVIKFSQKHGVTILKPKDLIESLK